MNVMRLTFALVAAAGLASSACLDGTTTVRVNGDGSGTIVARMLYTRAGQERLQQFAPLLGNPAGTLPGFSESDAKAAADRFGPGVTYTSSSPIKTADAEGFEATYSFADVSRLKLGAAPPQMALMDAAAGAASQPITFSVSRDSSGTAVLRIQSPPPDLSAAAALQASDPQSPIEASWLALIRSIAQGARVAVRVEPAGPIVRTNSPYVEDQRVVLLDVEIDRLLSDAAVANLAAVKDLESLKAFVKETSGVRIALEPEIVVEFTPR
jgi:hypothetical protein